MNRHSTVALALGSIVAIGLATIPVRAAILAQTAAARPEANDDAARAAAGRLLLANRFRDRQDVQMTDSLRAAQADLTSDCIDRATAGRDVADCRATALSDPRMKARLATSRSDLLDEIMTASQTIYARHFTAAEMDDITRFFRTPVGRKYGAPRILAEVQAREHTILRRYLVASASARKPAGILRP